MPPDRSNAVVALGRGRLEIAEIPIPEPQDGDGLLRVEACGVCGSDLKKFRRVDMAPTILGHETVGRVERIGAVAARRWGVSEGDRVLLEEYLPCGHCADCRAGEFRSCRQTDNQEGSGALRYGSTSTEVPPGLWGGYSEYQYLHPSSVLHPVPDDVAPEHAAFALPLSNGIQWMQMDANVRMGDVVIILGPGQQGLGCLIAAKAAGASMIVMTGLGRDRGRLDLATALGADLTVDTERFTLVDVIEEATRGAMADLVIDTTGAGAFALDQALAVVRKRGSIVLASGSTAALPPADLNVIRRKQLLIRGVRGHSFRAVELALRLISTDSVPVGLIGASPFPLAQTRRAFATVERTDGLDAVHATVSPLLGPKGQMDADAITLQEERR